MRLAVRCRLVTQRPSIGLRVRKSTRLERTPGDLHDPERRRDGALSSKRGYRLSARRVGPLTETGWGSQAQYGPVGHPALYAVQLDGSGRVLIARRASLPDWSPDGRTIAYRSPDGIKLVTPSGVDVTPLRYRPHAHIAPEGMPPWSPDGSTLAVATQRGVFLVDKTAAHLKLVIRNAGTGVFGPVSPAWYPGVSAVGAKKHEKNRLSTSTCGEC